MIFIIIGESCAGKSTLVNFLIKEYGLSLMKQYTTRQKRSIQDDEYYFISLSNFQKKIYINKKKYNGNYYGVAIESLEGAELENKILVTDYITGRRIKKKYDAQIIYIKTSMYNRIKRILNCNSRHISRIILDIFYSWEILLADKVLFNNKGMEELENEARVYFDEKIKCTETTNICENPK